MSGQVLTREHSSVGLEHLPYKQRVGGSTPSAPTRFKTPFQFTGMVFFFFGAILSHFLKLVWISLGRFGNNYYLCKNYILTSGR